MIRRALILAVLACASAYAQAPFFAGVQASQQNTYNRLTYSNVFTNAAWQVTGVATVTGNVGTGPLGLPYSTVVFDSSGTDQIAQSVPASDGWTFAVWVKGTPGQTIAIGFGFGGQTLWTLNGQWQHLYKTVANGTAVNGTTEYIGTWGGATATTVQVCCANLAFGAGPQPYVNTTANPHAIPKFALPPVLVTVPPNGLAVSAPPMGWDPWNAYGTPAGGNIMNLTTAQIEANVDAMVANGMKAAGYNYVLVEGWNSFQRTAAGVPVPQANITSITALANYIHAAGLKFGLINSPGTVDCIGNGSLGYEVADAATYASWGVDLVEWDWCSAEQDYAEYVAKWGNDVPRAAYQYFGQALQGTGRSILYKLSQYGNYNGNTWARVTGGNDARTTNDIATPSFAVISNYGLDSNAGVPALAALAGNGYWNDPDMLMVGNGSLTRDNGRFQLSLWALLAAPLISGNNLTTMSANTLSDLTYAPIIAIDQDSLGKQGVRVAQNTCGGTTCDVVAKQTSAGWSVGIFNRDASNAYTNVPVSWSSFAAGTYAITDVWSNASVGCSSSGYSAPTLAAGGTVVLNLVSTSNCAAQPVDSPGTGSYVGTQSVTLVSAGNTICYTLDGSMPTATTPGTCSHGTTYSGAFNISATSTLEAIATRSGYSNSTMLVSPYTITTVAVPAFVSSTFVAEGSGTLVASITSPALTLSGVSGEMVMVVCRNNTGGTNTSTVTSTPSNTWTTLTVRNNSLGFGPNFQASYAINPGSGSTTFTCTPQTSNGYQSMIVLHYTGIATSSPVDAEAGGPATFANGATYTSPTFNTAGADLIVMCGSVNTKYGTFTAGNIGAILSTIRQATGSSQDMACEDIIDTTSRTGITAAMTYSGAQYWAGGVVAFKP